MKNLTWTKDETDSIKKLFDSAETGNELMSLIEQVMEQRNQEHQTSN